MELLGRLGSEFSAFYIREHIDDKRYRVFLYSLSEQPLDGRLICSFSAMMIGNGFYVDEEMLIDSCQKGGLGVADLRAASQLEAGKVVAFLRSK